MKVNRVSKVQARSLSSKSGLNCDSKKSDLEFYKLQPSFRSFYLRLIKIDK